MKTKMNKTPEKNMNVIIAKNVDMFMKFCYCFPMDLPKRLNDYYGISLGEHFYDKFVGFNKKLPNNFYGLIATFNDMSIPNKTIFIKMITDYNNDRLINS